MWQWFNYVASKVPAGKSVLKLNLDETSFCLFQGAAKGSLMVSKRRLRDRIPDLAQRVSQSRRRTCLTHIGLICDRPDFQKFLPQVIIGNEHTFSAADWAALDAARPNNVVLVRQKSAWNKSELMVRVVKLIAQVLAAFSREVQPVLLMDACKVHVTKAVLEACVCGGVWPVIVPAKMTWLLQPCDTHAFLKLKFHLKAVSYPQARARAEAADGSLSVSEFLAALYDAIRVVLEGKPWAGAFAQDGYGRDQAWLSRSALRHLEYDQPPVVPRTQPSLEQVQLCFPKKWPVPLATLYRPFQALPLPAAKAAPVARGRMLAPKRLGVSAGSAALALPAPAPPPAAAPAPSSAGPVTRGQSRLIAALAKGPSWAPSSSSSGPSRPPRLKARVAS